MSRRFVISDLHLGHKGILNLGSRGIRFRDVQHMDNHIMENLHNTVSKRDTLYIVGDLSMHDSDYAESLLSQLDCTVVVIGGNHDKPFKLIEKVYGAFSLRVHGFKVVLTHIPIHPQEFYRWRYNIHGHLHEKFVWTDWKTGLDGSVKGTRRDPRYINVCAEPLNFTPVQVEDIVPKNIS